jgi:hypothetical protein
MYALLTFGSLQIQHNNILYYKFTSFIHVHKHNKYTRNIHTQFYIQAFQESRPRDYSTTTNRIQHKAISVKKNLLQNLSRKKTDLAK